MELKDVILSTLAEMEESSDSKSLGKELVAEDEKKEENFFKPTAKESSSVTPSHEDKNESNSESELLYLNSIRERLLVLFEGFQAPNNTNIEAKVDMTLNFLEYMLATIDTRVIKLEKGNI